MSLIEQPPTDPALPAIPPPDAKRGVEQRASRRFADATPAELRVKRQRYPVQIVDVSSEGCAFTVQQDPGLNLGDHAELRTDSFLAQIEVVSRTALDAKGRAAGRARFRFGVRRLWDEPLPDKNDRPERGLQSWLLKSSSTQSNNWAMVFGLIALLCLAGFGVWWMLCGRTDRSNESLFSTFFPALFAPAKKAALVPQGSEETPSVFWNWMAAGRATADAAAAKPVKHAGFGGESASAKAAALFQGSFSEAVGGAALTSQQETSLEQIGRIADAAIAALAKNKEVSAEEAARRREMLLEAARQQVQRVLSGEQRAAAEQDRSASN